MPVSSPGLVALNGGEWSKRLWGRYDQDKYLNSLRRCENFIPLVHGPVIRRPGFKFASWVRRNEADLRIVPFVYSQDQAYILEFTDDGSSKKLRFFRDRSAVTETEKNITAITKANPGVVTSASHGYSAGDEVFITGVGGMTEVNGRRFRVGTTATNTFQLLDPITGANVNTTNYTTYTSGGTAARIYELTHPYAAADLPNLKWAQALDTMFLFCPGYAPRKLTRTTDTSWAFSTPAFDDGPYLPENATDTTITLGAFSGNNVSITFSSTTGVNGGAGLSSADIGRLVRVLTTFGSPPRRYEWAVLRIDGVSSTTVGTADFVRAGLGDHTDTQREWRLGYWNDDYGWPTSGVFHKGRLWLAATESHPESVWGSVAEDFQNFAPAPNSAFEDDVIPGPTPANAINLVASDDQAALVRWLLPMRPLMAGCSAGEQAIKASNLDEALGPDNATISSASSVGAADTPPARVDGAGLFLDRTRRRLHELAYTIQADSVAAVDLSLYAEHIGQQSALARIAWQRNPWRVLWACRDDGALVGFTYEREQNVVAWHRHPLGGTDAAVVDLACIPSTDGQDELWIVVERTIDGGTRRFLEYMVADRWAADADDKDDWFYVDSGLTYDGSATTTLSRLDHLEGETVTILADGAAHATKVVSAGGVTLDRSASVVQVGLGYSSTLETNNLEVGNPLGAAAGRPKTLHSATVLLFDSLGGKVGPGAGNLETILYRTPSGAMNASPPLFTGSKKVEWPGGWEREKRIHFLQDQPLPMNLAGFVPQMQTNEMAVA